MKRWAVLIVLGGLVVSALIFAGCEWGGTSDDVSSSTNETNGPAPNATPVSPTEIAFSHILLDSGEAGRTAYSGSIPAIDGGDWWPGPMVSGSFTISAGGFHFTDNGDGTMNGTMPGTDGTIQYDTGSWSIDLGGADIVDNQPILGSYVCLDSSTNSP